LIGALLAGRADCNFVSDCESPTLTAAVLRAGRSALVGGSGARINTARSHAGLPSSAQAPRSKDKAHVANEKQRHKNRRSARIPDSTRHWPAGATAASVSQQGSLFSVVIEVCSILAFRQEGEDELS
jgi:hypothetical protein